MSDTDGVDEEATLGDRIRCGDADALAEVYARYLPLLVSLARRHGIAPGERRELAQDVVAEVVMQLLRDDRAAPRSLGALLATVLRRRAIDRRRREGTRVRAVGLDEARDAAAEPAGDDAAPALAGLARHLEAHVDETELRILYWLGEHVPQRVIAEWLGTSHGALRMRVSRLRERLRQVARTYCAAVDDESHAALGRFFAASATASHATAHRNAPRTRGGRRHGSST